MGPGEAHVHRIARLLYQGQSKFQQMQIVETAHCGKALVLDGRIQSSEFDEFVYHEALVHPPMLAHPRPEKVLCIGGGPGAVVREVLRHPSVRSVTLVDIDQEVVELSRRHLPHMHRGALDDPRTRIVFGDGRRFVEESKDVFDVVILDLSEPLPGSPACLLYTSDFYRAIRSRLSPHGSLALQAGTASPVHLKVFPSTVMTLRAAFAAVDPYWEHVQSFGTAWSYVVATDGEVRPARWEAAEVDRRLAERRIDGLRFYDGAAHQRMFLIPKHLAARMAEKWPVITDDNAMYTFEEGDGEGA